MLFWKKNRSDRGYNITAFQSLFCWMLFWKLRRSSSATELIWFQSLFCWMLFWKIFFTVRTAKPYRVSILVLLDVILKDVHPNRTKCKIGFQSLFCWMLFWKPSDHTHPIHQSPVSILVLLDVILKDQSYQRITWALSVSILVLLDVILKARHRNWRWMIRSSFNPCFVGCYSERMMAGKENYRLALFQSLFCWMLFWKLDTGAGTKETLSVSILVLLDVILKVQLTWL